MKRIYLYLLLLTAVSAVNGQIGREFWFAAPDIWEGYGDAPLVLRVTTFEEAATITVSLPAEGGKILSTQTVQPYSHLGIELNKNDVENSPANQVNNKGLLISSTADIAAYYDISAADNPDKFILKEDKALGFEFYVPGQNSYGNCIDYSGKANEKADIVATEDNTTVTITPAVDVTGHAAGVPFTITLNKGQTYCIENRNIAPASTLAGTHMMADKRIAVTVSDDAIVEDVNSFPKDLIGDQLVPVNVIGNEYIAMNTSKASSSYKNQNSVQKIFVLAIEDNTLVFANNTTKNAKALNKGEIAEFDISDHALYIYATKKVYAYQLTGLVNPNSSTIANEIGSAILPSYSCNGSSSVSFTRVFNRDFWVNIIIKRKDVKNFILYDNNGNDIGVTKYIKSWQTVPGQGTGQDAWVCCAVNLDELSTGVPYRLENTSGLFHLCILDESDSKKADGGGASFGYFSSYNSFYAAGAGDKCLGEEILLEAKEGMKNYTWYSVETGNQVLSTDRVLTVTEGGKYWVEAEVAFGGCIIADTLNVNFLFPEVDLGNDTTVCQGEVLDYEVEDAYSAYLWSNGDTNHQTQIVADGSTSELNVIVTDAMGCTNSDTVQIDISPVPDIVLDATTVCEGTAVINTTGFERYEWRYNGVVLNEDESQNWIIPAQSGTYTVTAWTIDECSASVTIDITVLPLPSFTLADQTGCQGSVVTIDGPAGFVSYNWSTGEQTQSIDVSTGGNYWLEVTDANGCLAREEAQLSLHEPLYIDLGPDRDECVGITLTIGNESNYTGFNWTFEPTNNPGTIENLNPIPAHEYQITNSTVDNSGKYRVEAMDVNGCPVSDDVNVAFYTTNPIDLIITKDLCDGESVDVIASEGYDTYSWTIDNISRPEFDNQNSITNVSSGAVYEVIATSGTCTKRNEITVAEHSLPEVKLPDLFSLCDGLEQELMVESFSSPDNAKFGYLYWNGNVNSRYSDWQTASLKVSSPGLYSVTAVDEYGCAATDDVDVNSMATTPLNLVSPPPACDNETVDLPNAPADAQSYSWYCLGASGESHLADNTPLTIDASGTYVLKVVDVNGCDVSDDVVVNIYSSPTVDLGDDISACGDISIGVSPKESYTQYQWNDNPALNTQSLLVTQSGAYKLEVLNRYGCRAEDVVNVSLFESPIVELEDFTDCAGTLATLSGPAGDYQYLWSNGAVSQSVTVGNGYYTLKVTDVNGCSSTADASVVWRPVPQVDLGPDMIICPVDNWVLDAGNGYASYLWHNGATSQFITANLMDTVNTVVVTDEFGCTGFDSQTLKHRVAQPIGLLSDTSVCSFNSIWIDADMGFEQYEWSTGEVVPSVELDAAGTYWLRAFDGCVWASDTMQLVVHPTPMIAYLDTSIYAQAVVMADGGTSPYWYAINDEDLQESNVFSKLSNGEHIFYVEDINGCFATDTLLLDNVLEIGVPPVLTPNGDGYNDTWHIKGLDKLPDSIIRVFDRYGKLLVEFYASDPPWDGKYLGKPLPSDAYWYVIQLKPIDKIMKGHLTIKR
ncbi:T9SS type B sorting domain-containing protein [Carboxylicivirga sediminis]|uniref:T9SS type B sorting domain-containing protein n=1 Tax=Carboxylicivirga sediminis TaxID=2006564 RepID=A0A941IUB4_9BACT|nr:T9SS type B sorting domain-containing protein [Carboxylicivirga sediminis]MBR8534195.1 T9SS type B sorting domain-containing protein [Carboxylicivirga sediminis]